MINEVLKMSKLYIKFIRLMMTIDWIKTGFASSFSFTSALFFCRREDKKGKKYQL